MLKWTPRSTPSDEAQNLLKSKPSLSFNDLTFIGKEPRGLRISNLSKEGFICMSRSTSEIEEGSKGYQISVLELGLDLQVKRKIMLEADENQEFFNRIIYFGQGNVVLRYLGSERRDGRVHYLSLDLEAEELKKIFDCETNFGGCAISAGNHASGVSFAYTVEGIERLVKLTK